MKLKRFIIVISLAFIFLGAAGWFFGKPYIERRIQIKLGEADVHYLIISINMFRAEFGAYPIDLDEIVSKKLLTPFDLKLMTSRARIIYLPPSNNALDPRRILIQGDVHGIRFLGRESLEIETTKTKTEQGA